MPNKKKEIECGFITVLTVLAGVYLLDLVLGFCLTDSNAYNTYALQANAWRQGRLDLGQDYPWLELAILNGKYYCSFPPFPSYILFPLTFFFGSQTPDYFIIILADGLIALYLYRLATKTGVAPEGAMLLTVFATLGANTLFVMVNPSVWFMAQLFCFATSVMAIFYAEEGKSGRALFLWAASVGCRPMQVLFLPLLLILLYRREREKTPEATVMQLILQRWYRVLPAGIVAVSYILLNYLRFGNILEFGHNYLPEFVRADYGQFHISYVPDNVISLLRLPRFTEDGRLYIDSFGNLNFMIVSPIVLVMLMGTGYAIYKKNKQLMLLGILVLLLSAGYLLIVTMHRTMGGWQFGNRYAIDILPYVYLCVSVFSAQYRGTLRYSVPLCIWGLFLNAIGTAVVYSGM